MTRNPPRILIGQRKADRKWGPARPKQLPHESSPIPGSGRAACSTQSQTGPDCRRGAFRVSILRQADDPRSPVEVQRSLYRRGGSSDVTTSPGSRRCFAGTAAARAVTTVRCRPIATRITRDAMRSGPRYFDIHEPGGHFDDLVDRRRETDVSRPNSNRDVQAHHVAVEQSAADRRRCPERCWHRSGSDPHTSASLPPAQADAAH